MDIKSFSAKQCAQVLADPKTSKSIREAVIARVKAKAKESPRKAWKHLLKDINAGLESKIQARAGLISWDEAKANAPAKPEPKAKPEIVEVPYERAVAILTKRIPTKAERAELLAWAAQQA